MNQILLYLEKDSDLEDYMGYIWTSEISVSFFLRVFIFQHTLHLVNLAIIIA